MISCRTSTIKYFKSFTGTYLIFFYNGNSLKLEKNPQVTIISQNSFLKLLSNLKKCCLTARLMCYYCSYLYFLQKRFRSFGFKLSDFVASRQSITKVSLIIILKLKIIQKLKLNSLGKIIFV